MGAANQRPAAPPKNRLLAALPDAVLRRWLPHLEQVTLAQGSLLYECGAPTLYVYFPSDAIVSLMYGLADGASAEVAMVGFEGVVGLWVVLSAGPSRTSAVVQSAGLGHRMRAEAFRAECEQSLYAMRLMLRYTQALGAQLAQIAVCNRHHALDQQLCRCLLLCMDRLPCPDLHMTHELIASMLGVRREGVTEAALKLQRAGIIRYSRGHIHVLDRRALEARACECYQALSSEYRRLLSATVSIADPRKQKRSPLGAG